MNIWRELSRILWHRSERNNAYLASMLVWMLSALDFFLVIVKAPSIAGDFDHLDHVTYQQWTERLNAITPFADLAPILALAVTVMLIARFVGATIFGPLAEREGRRRWLLRILALLSLTQIASGLIPFIFPSFPLFLALRFLFGACMGGSWSVGAALCMDWVPNLPNRNRRGLVSGFFQQGYPLGNLLAAIIAIGAGLMALFIHPPFPFFGWRIIFMVAGTLGLILLWTCAHWFPFGESAAWDERHPLRPATPAPRGTTSSTSGATSGRMHAQAPAASGADPSVRVGWPMREPDWWKALPRRLGAAQSLVFLYAVALMIAFSWMAHGSQDVYPTFLQQQVRLQNFNPNIVVVIYSLGGTIGGYFFAYYSDQARFGRRRCIIIPAFLGLLLIPLWTGLFPWGIGGLEHHQATGPLSAPAMLVLIGVFLMQFMVQGAWGVVPVHLYELSTTLTPRAWRAIFSGIVYHAGTLVGPLALLAIALLAKQFGTSAPDYSVAQALVLAVIFLLLIVLAAFVRPDEKAKEQTASGKPSLVAVAAPGAP